jgi:outer membrane protein TolC
MKRTLPIFLGFLAAASPDVSAQDAAIRLTLDEAIARGIANSQRIAELQAREEAAGAVAAGRRAAGLPSVALVGGYTRTNHVDEFGVVQPGQSLRIIYPDVPDNYRARLDLQWPIYTGGRAEALERAALAERSAAVADLAAARSDLRLEITRAFWAIVTAAETERVLTRSIESVDAHVRDLASRLEQGLIPPNEVLTAEAQRSRQRVLAIEAANVRSIADADLQRLLGMDMTGRVEPAASLAEPAPPAVDATAAVRPERLALDARTAAARAREKAAVASARPQVALNGGYDYARPNPRIFPRSGEWLDSWDLSVNVSWTLWDGGRRAAEQAEAAAGTRASAARAGEFDRQAAFEVRQRRLELDSSRAAIGAAEDGVRAATEASRVVHERYNAGVATSTEVLDAELAVLQAGLDGTRARANARLAQARLERAVGVRSEETGERR